MKLTEIINRQYGLSEFPENTPYAMAYVPFQALTGKLYSADNGFMAGTMYPSLDKPFRGGKCGDGNDEA